MENRVFSPLLGRKRQSIRNGGGFFMFGILRIVSPQQPSFGERVKLRMRSGKGMRWEKTLFRMAMFTVMEVSLSPRWRDSLRKKRVAAGLRRLKAMGAEQVILPEEWEELARALELEPVLARSALEDCASQAVLEACRGLNLAPEAVCLEVWSGPVSHKMFMQLLTLSRAVGEIRLHCPGSGELSRRLASVREAGREPLSGGLPLTLRLAGGKPPAGPFVVDLSGEAAQGEVSWVPRLLPPDGALARLPADVDAGAFAAALLGCGALQGREIHILPLDIQENAPYNKKIPAEDAV